jgi:hypothetical protein
MQVRGAIATKAFGGESDIDDWANQSVLNPSRIAPDQRNEPSVQTAVARLGVYGESGLKQLAKLAGVQV